MCLKTRHWHQHATVAEKVLAVGSSKHFNARFAFCQTALIPWFLKRAWFSVLKEGQRKKLPFLLLLPARGVCKTWKGFSLVDKTDLSGSWLLSRITTYNLKFSLQPGKPAHPAFRALLTTLAPEKYWWRLHVWTVFLFPPSLLFLLAHLNFIQGILSP